MRPAVFRRLLRGTCNPTNPDKLPFQVNLPGALPSLDARHLSRSLRFFWDAGGELGTVRKAHTFLVCRDIHGQRLLRGALRAMPQNALRRHDSG